MDKFKQYGKYNLGDVVEYNGYRYIIDSLYDNDQAETLVCDCDGNRYEEGKKVHRDCPNCGNEWRDEGEDEDGMPTGEFLNTGFTDKMTVINDPSIDIEFKSSPTALKVRVK